MSECKYKLNVSYLLLMDLIRLYESNMYVWGLAVRWDVAFRCAVWTFQWFTDLWVRCTRRNWTLNFFWCRFGVEKAGGWGEGHSHRLRRIQCVLFLLTVKNKTHPMSKTNQTILALLFGPNVSILVSYGISTSLLGIIKVIIIYSNCNHLSLLTKIYQRN